MKTLKSKPDKKNKTRKENKEEVKLKSLAKSSSQYVDMDLDKQNQRHYWELVDKYYQLKSKYEKDTKKLVDTIKDPDNVKRKESVKQLVAPCVNCRRNVGSNFNVTQTKMDHVSGRLYSLRCGDPVEPCSLHISFMLPNITNFNEIFNRDRRKIRNYKIDTIFCKNDLIFQYVDEDAVMHRFDVIKESLNNLLNDNSYSMDIYLMLTKPPELKDQTTFIDEYKRLMDEYKTTKSPNLLRDAIQIYISEILPRGKENMKNTYLYNNVENENEYKLVQQELPLSNLETIGRFPLIYEDLNAFIISQEKNQNPQNPQFQLKKTSKKIVIVPATEAQSRAE